MAVKLDKLFNDTLSLDVKTLTYIANYKTDIDLWIASLAELELGEAAKQIFITLLELRSFDCNDVIRFQIIQQIEPHLNHLLISLEQHYLNNTLLDTKRDQQISDLVLEIKSHHALLYVELLNRVQHTLDTHKFSFFDFNLKKKLLILRKQTTLFALERLTNLLYSLQLLYFDAPRNFWLRAYHTYQIAVCNDYHTEKMEKNDELEHPVDSAQKAFTQLVLLQLLNNHKLRQSEIKELMQCIGYWTSLVQFSEQPHDNSNYIIRYTTDTSPHFYLNNEHNEEKCLFLKLAELNAYIESTLQPNAHYYSRIEEKLLTNVLKHHILNVLTLDPAEILPRYTEGGTFEVTLGMTSAHFFLSHAKHFKETLELNIDLSLKSQNQILSSIPSEKETQLSTRLNEQRFNAEVTKIYQVNVVNRSDSGYGLQWHNKMAKNFRTGEFILLKEHKNEQWIGAIIRWMKNTADQTIEFGVERIAQNMSPVAVSIPKQNAIPIYHPAILYTDEHNNYTIILPSAQVFFENQNLSLRFGTTELRIYLKQSHILTQNCATFSFDLLEQSKRSLLDQYFQHHLTTLKTQDLWELLK